MATWTTIAVDDLNQYQAGKLVNAARTKALAAGQTDPFPFVMPDVIRQIRDDISANPVNQLSATTNSVPNSLRQAAILLTIEAMMARLPGLSADEIQPGLASLIKDAKARLLRIANGKLQVEIPDDAIAPPEVQRAGDIETVGDRPIKNDRGALSRL